MLLVAAQRTYSIRALKACQYRCLNNNNNKSGSNCSVFPPGPGSLDGGFTDDRPGAQNTLSRKYHHPFKHTSAPPTVGRVSARMDFLKIYSWECENIWFRATMLQEWPLARSSNDNRECIRDKHSCAPPGSTDTPPVSQVIDSVVHNSLETRCVWSWRRNGVGAFCHHCSTSIITKARGATLGNSSLRKPKSPSFITPFLFVTHKIPLL